MAHKNIMGSEVEKGYKCKPVVKDPNRPIMHYKTQLFICDGGRCHKVAKDQFADKLREIVKGLDLQSGENRIKITRTMCFGACRFKQVGQFVENSQRNGFEINSNIWFKNAHKISDEKWRKIFMAISKNQDIKVFVEQIEMEEA
ncbi:MAG: (2Fe-2S) ferredoxin domain-containing protein [Campylobacterales bacterium]|nr:(2Fe-2S) ferredoxin domain-containing protein [Campylobacterales bacterium]